MNSCGSAVAMRMQSATSSSPGHLTDEGCNALQIDTRSFLSWCSPNSAKIVHLRNCFGTSRSSVAAEDQQD